jgi:membrane fusion protein (multidrug efflux system)
MWVIDEGLKPGDRIVVEGLQRVKTGMTVVPKEVSNTAEPAAEPAKEAGK